MHYFVHNQYSKFLANAYNTKKCTMCHVYSSTIPIQLFLSLRQSKINPIFEYPFLYFGLYLVYLQCHFLSPSYLMNKSNYL